MVCIKQFMLVFQDSNNSQRKDLCLMGTNAWVSGLRILHADTPARLSAGAAQEYQKDIKSPLETIPPFIVK